MSLQIECLAPLIPQNGHAASSSTASLSSLPSAAPVSSPSGWSPPSSTLFPRSRGGGVSPAGRQSKVPPPLRQCGTAPRAAFHSHAGSVS